MAQLQLSLDRGVNAGDSAVDPTRADLSTVEDFPRFQDIQHGHVYGLTLSANTSPLTHGLHRFPAKYIPQIPRWAMREFAERQSIVLDPFMGSGTTLIEGLCSAHHTIGIDIDPLARLITSAKTFREDIQQTRALAEDLLRRSKCKVDLFVPMEGVQNFLHWFSEDAWYSLCGLYRAIERMDCTPNQRQFFFCVFSSILRRVSRADDQTQKTYVSGTLAKNPPPVHETFERHLERALRNAEALSQSVRGGVSSYVVNASAGALPIRDAAIDLIVTSPPYLDSVDYMYNLMLEYFWLGPKLGVPSRSDFNARRRQAIGAKNPLGDCRSIKDELEHLVLFEQLPKYRQAASLAYFGAMARHFEEAARVTKPGGVYVLVIGNSQVTTGAVPVHDCLLQLAHSAGFTLVKAFAYRIRRHYMKFPRKGRGGIILLDWVITLRKARSTSIGVKASRLPMPHIEFSHDQVAN